MLSCTTEVRDKRQRAKNHFVASSRDITFTTSISSDIMKLFNQKMVERGEKNKSELVEFLMTCWIYLDDDNCESCPYYEPPCSSSEIVLPDCSNKKETKKE